MKLRLLTVPLFLAAIALRVDSVSADVRIVVNFGPHPSAEVAAGSEAKVDWLDTDTADDTLCTECFAAVELQAFLRRLTGRTADFVIVDDDVCPAGEIIVVGGPTSNAVARQLAASLAIEPAPLAALGPEGYRIKTDTIGNHRVTIVAGGSRVGTLYGVYDLLHRLGCRWFGPEQFHEEIPRAEWQPDFDVTAKPDFASRGFYIFQQRGGPEFWLWMARNRLNDWYVQASDVPYLRKLGFRLACGSHDAQWRFLNPTATYPYDHRRILGDEDRPRDPYAIGAEYQGDVDKDGKLSYFEAHPEWFALKGGKRIAGISRNGGVNFCTSNADAAEEFTKNYVQALIDGDYRGADVVNFWTLDDGKWCQCSYCQAEGGPTDRFLRLVCRFDRQVKKAQCAKRLNRPIDVRFLAYSDVVQPPTRPLPADFDYSTCTATFYPISRCFVHQFNDASCSHNADYQKILFGWLLDPNRHYRGQMTIGEYYNVSRYKSLPICFMHVMAHDIPYYHQAGARYFQYMHVTTERWGNKSLTNYQMARQLWDVDTDCEELWSDYFARRYGPAAEVMRSFYDSLEKMLSNIEPLKGWRSSLASRLQKGGEELFVEPHLRYRREAGIECDAPTLVEMVANGKECRKLINRALELPVPERIKTRIAEDERMFTYGERTLDYYDACVRAMSLGHAGRLEEARLAFAEAKRLANLLRHDTWSVSLRFDDKDPIHPDAFDATCAIDALEHLTKLLGSTELAE